MRITKKPFSQVMAAHIASNEKKLFEYLGRVGDYKDYSVSKSKSAICFNKIQGKDHSGTTRFIKALKIQKSDHEEEVADESKGRFARLYGFLSVSDEFVDTIITFF